MRGYPCAVPTFWTTTASVTPSTAATGSSMSPLRCPTMLSVHLLHFCGTLNYHVRAVEGQNACLLMLAACSWSTGSL